MSKMAPEMLALQRLYHWEKTSPNRVAFTQPMGGGVVQDTTWGEVANQVRRMANYLQSKGWEPGSKVAILSKNCSWWIMSDLAIWMAGYVSVPLYPTLAAATVHQILTHSEAKACFIGKLDGWEQMKPGVPVGMPCLSYPLSPPDAIKSYPGWEKICKDTPPLQGNRERGGDELATLIYTSGTTGLPMGADDRMLSYLPLAHVVERVLVEHGWLRTGMQVFFADSLDTFAADLQRARPTIFFSVPRLWVKFQQGVHHKMPQAKLNLLLSIPILSGIVRRKLLKALGLDQCRIAAEHLALSHITEPGKNQQGTVGPAYDGVEDRIDPENGEIQMRSPALMLGYYKEPEKTREAMTEDGWLRTGDKGRLDKQRVLSITGRVKDLFKTGKGKYVAPAPIEDKLMTHEAIEACVVTGANLGQPLGIIMLGADYQVGPPMPAHAPNSSNPWHNTSKRSMRRSTHMSACSVWWWPVRLGRLRTRSSRQPSKSSATGSRSCTPRVTMAGSHPARK